MAAEGSGGGDKEFRRRDMLNIDELINIVLTKANSRTGRRVVTAACFIIVSAVVVYPILSHSSPAPAGDGDLSTLTMTLPEVPSTSATLPALEEPFVAPDLSGRRFGPPLPTDPPATTTTAAPSTTTTATTVAP